MEFCKHTKPTGRIYLVALAAAAGTFLLAFVPGGNWMNGAESVDSALSAHMIKAILTTLLLLVVPSLWARLAHVISPWILVILTGLALGSGFIVTAQWSGGLYLALMIALPGVGLYALQRMRLSNFRTVLYGSFVNLAALFAHVCLKDLVENGNAYLSAERIIGLYDEALKGMIGTGAEPAGSQMTELIRQAIDLYRQNIETIVIPVLLMAAMTASLSNTLFSHAWNRNGDAPLRELPRFEDWHCERWYVIMIAIFSIVTAILSFSGVQAAMSLTPVAEVLWRMPCTLAGLCTIRKIGLRIGRGWILWIAVAMLIVLPPITGMILTLLGMLSSLRNRTNVGEDGLRK